jgi:hypothetical protein
MARLLCDWLSFSSLWVGLAAGLLCWASTLALGLSPIAAAVGMASAGTIVVYNLDRLLDLDRDRPRAPLRSRFIAEHRAGLIGITVFAGAASLGCALSLGPKPIALLLSVFALGLIHRRLKHRLALKVCYLAAAWLAVVVGLPVVLRPEATGILWVSLVVGSGLVSNAIASNLPWRDERANGREPGAGLWWARGAATTGLLLASVAPTGVRALAGVPLAVLVTLLGFRSDERYGLFVVDGALVAGAGLAVVALSD